MKFLFQFIVFLNQTKHLFENEKIIPDFDNCQFDI
jgi:hypothetical protein